MKKLVLAGLVSAFLVGCSSTPITESTGKQVPNDLIINKNIVVHREGLNPITFLRDTGPGRECTHTIYANGEQVFHIQDGQYITIYLPNGDYFFRLTSGHGLCPNVDVSQTTIINNKAQKFRIMFQSNSATINLVRIQ